MSSLHVLHGDFKRGRIHLEPEAFRVRAGFISLGLIRYGAVSQIKDLGGVAGVAITVSPMIAMRRVTLRDGRSFIAEGLLSDWTAFEDRVKSGRDVDKQRFGAR